MCSRKFGKGFHIGLETLLNNVVIVYPLFCLEGVHLLSVLFCFLGKGGQKFILSLPSRNF